MNENLIDEVTLLKENKLVLLKNNEELVSKKDKYTKELEEKLDAIPRFEPKDQINSAASIDKNDISRLEKIFALLGEDVSSNTNAAMLEAVLAPTIDFGQPIAEKIIHEKLLEELISLQRLSIAFESYSPCENLDPFEKKSTRRTIGKLMARLLGQIPAYDPKTKMPSKEFKF